MKFLTGLLTLGIILATLITAGTAVSAYHEQYLATCPSKDVLQPDGNIRMIAALDRYQDIRDGRYFSAVSSYLRANTWPPLRPTISLVLFALSPSGPSAIVDTSISLIFYALLFPSLIFIAMRIAPSPLLGAAGAFLTSIVLIHSKQLPAYSLASMLETQGMFFLLWTLYFLYNGYKTLYPRPEDLSPAERTGFQFPRNEAERLLTRGGIIGLALSVQGLVLTKYPYAVMLFLAVVVCEVLRSPGSYVGLVKRALGDYYRPVRLIVYALLIGCLVTVIILAKTGKFGPKGVNARGVKNVMYLVCLIVFVDFNVYAWRYRRVLANIVPASMRYFYLAGMLPALTWIFLHPDRFNSVVGGGLWVPPPGVDPSKLFRSTFFDTLLNHTFDHTSAVLLILLGMVAGIGLYKLMRFRVSPVDETSVFRRLVSYSLQLMQSPLMAVTVILWVQFLAQEFLSPNKQDRHIFHFLPALLLIAVVWITRVPSSIAGIARGVGGVENKSPSFVGPALALALFACGAAILYSAGGLFSGRYFHASRPLCFAGMERNLFEPARWAAARVEPGKKYMVINRMYNIPLRDPIKRDQGTEIDLLLRTRAIPAGGTVMNDNRHLFKSWRGFERLLVVAPDCNSPDADAASRARAARVGATFSAARVFRHPSKLFCVKQFELK